MLANEQTIKKRIFSGYNIAFILIILILFALPVLHVNVRNLPYIYNDEFGYWFNAAEFNGLDWSETFSKISYYSFGYSLILAIPLAIFKDIGSAYHCAVLLNGVWLALGFVFLYKTARLIYPNQNKYLSLIAALAASLFSSNFAQVNYTWPEVFLYMLFCMMCYLIISILQSPSKLKMILLSLLSIYSYCVHQRTLGIVIAVCIISIFLVATKRIKMQEWFCFVLIFIICLVVAVALKSNVIDSFWNNSASTAGNNFSGQTGKILSLFSIQGLLQLLFSVLGKLFYIFAATFLLAPYACYIMISEWLFDRKHTVEFKLNYKTLLGIFLLMSILFSLGINSVFMLTPESITHLVYGRYIDNLLGPFMLIGIIEFANHNFSIKVNACLICLFSVISFAVYCAVDYYQLNIQEAINNIGISYLVDYDSFKIVLSAFSIIALWIIINLIKSLINEETSVIINSCILVCIFATIGNGAYQTFEDKNWADASNSSNEIAGLIEEILVDNPEMEIYAITASSSGSYPASYSGNGIQFLLKDQTVFSISVNEAKTKQWLDNCIILSPSDMPLFSWDLEQYSVVYEDNIYKVQVPTNVKDMIVVTE